MHKINQMCDQLASRFTAEVLIWSQCFALNENMACIFVDQILLQILKNIALEFPLSCIFVIENHHIRPASPQWWLGLALFYCKLCTNVGYSVRSSLKSHYVRKHPEVVFDSAVLPEIRWIIWFEINFNLKMRIHVNYCENYFEKHTTSFGHNGELLDILKIIHCSVKYYNVILG